jgi:hypothetical protein
MSALSSGVLTTSGEVIVAPVSLTGLEVLTDGSHGVTVTLYDNISAATGNVLYEAVCAATPQTQTQFIPIPIQASAGIYMNISGTGGSAIVYYDLNTNTGGY